MVFSTPVFFYLFLPLVLAVYYLVPQKWRNLVLFLTSCLFYFWGERMYFAIMLVSTVVDYTHGLLVERFLSNGNRTAAKCVVASSVMLNLGILFFFKYWDFLAESLQRLGLTFMPVLGIHLPIGISFYTFQTMSYTIDVYRGDAKAQRSILNFGTFVTLFPQLIAGPILKYKDLGGQIDRRSCTMDRFASGAMTFTVGLAKKVLLANNVGSLWELTKATPLSELTTLGAWLGIAAYTLQIYFDFSGYSDMAIGLGRMFGFEFLPNFDHPYTAQSITEFWRRWHISLSTWFREYLYIPLGGNRCSRAKWIRNLLIVWACTGLWHGASWNYLLWGLYFFVILLLEKLFLRKWIERWHPVLRHIYTMVLVMISWAIFALEDTAQLGGYFLKLLVVGGPLFSTRLLYDLRNYLPVLLLGAVASTGTGQRLYNRLPQWAAPVLLALGLLACSAYVVAGTYNPFLYFRF